VLLSFFIAIVNLVDYEYVNKQIPIHLNKRKIDRVDLSWIDIFIL